jgi:hypothetical protein
MLAQYRKITLLVLFALITFHKADAQWLKNKKKKKADTINVPAPAPAPVMIIDKPKIDPKELNEYTKRFKKIPGLFTLFQDTTSGVTYMLVRQEQLDKEYIYFSHIVDGIALTGHHRGSFKDNKIITFRKHFSKIDIVHENTNFYFDKNSALSRASGANISAATMASQSIVAENKDKTEYLIKVDDVFMSEYLQQIKPATSAGFALGYLNKDKSKFLQLRSYPLNTDLIVEYVYDNPAPTRNWGNDLADARFVSIKLQHSFIEMPENNFKPRYDDPRVGFFTTQADDMTSLSATPYRDVIHRWNLEKRDKDSALSEPIEPIVFWIENTTPTALRPVIKAAGLAWNEAFEKAGFKNAIQIKEQPDNADWEAGDIRYNVLRWTSSPNPPFGGYGPSFVNPRTGQILGADIMLEYVFMTNRLKQARLFNSAGLMHMEIDEHEHAPGMCSMGSMLQQSTMFGSEVLKARNESEAAMQEYSESSLFYLILHEMGHTLGLNHNMKASQLHTPESVNDKELTSQVGLMASVMDYPAVNLNSKKGLRQGQYFTTKPGPYDNWAIEFAYSEGVDDPSLEQSRLNTILARSTQPELAFGNDADDMRSPGKGIDPRVMIGDMSNDAIGYAIDRIKLCNELTHELKTRYTVQNKSYHELRNAYLILTGEMNTSAGVVSRYIGGIYVDRAFAGQEGSKKPFEPVSYADQKRAMKGLADHVFSPEALTAPEEVYSHLQMQRRGFDFYGSNEDPKITDRILNIHRGVINHLLHPSVLKRMTDSEQYGNKYKLGEMMQDLSDGVFKADLRKPVNAYRRNLQVEYVVSLLEVAGLEGKIKTDYNAQAMAHYQLRQIRKTLQANPSADMATKAHREYLIHKISKGLDGAKDM